MNSTTLLALFRSEMTDAEAPYLWADSDVFGYMDDAQKMHCRRTDGILDATNADVTQIAVAPNTDWVTLHPTIRRIRSARRSTTGMPVEIINDDDMQTRRWYFDGVTGTVKALVIGAEQGKARVYPKSNETFTLQLNVFRMPLTGITAGSQNFEIAEEHHRHLLLWMKHLAYLKQDAETFDRMKAAECAEMAEAYWARLRLEDQRKAFKPRTVAYGGI